MKISNLYKKIEETRNVGRSVDQSLIHWPVRSVIYNAGLFTIPFATPDFKWPDRDRDVTCLLSFVGYFAFIALDCCLTGKN